MPATLSFKSCNLFNRACSDLLIVLAALSIVSVVDFLTPLVAVSTAAFFFANSSNFLFKPSTLFRRALCKKFPLYQLFY